MIPAFAYQVISDYTLNNALLHHCARHFHEAGNVCAFHEVEVVIRLAVTHTLVVNILHDLVETDIHFFV